MKAKARIHLVVWGMIIPRRQGISFEQARLHALADSLARKIQILMISFGIMKIAFFASR